MNPTTCNHKTRHRVSSFPAHSRSPRWARRNAGLEERVPEIIVGLGMAVLNGSVRTRPSSEGNYVSVSVTFTARRARNMKRRMRRCGPNPAVKWTL